MKKSSRYPNLDLLRALAVMTVVIYHCCNMSGVPLWLWKWVEALGSNSVELFCVLSGFLIGSLYWDEHDRQGNVDIKIFILRRIYRTVPMYFIFMSLAYLAVYVARQQEFSWYYLFFLQNYHISIPFYVISWTLCVEEHFYMVMPFALWLFIKLPRKTTIILLIILAFIPPVCRLLYYADNVNMAFGYYGTASHFRYEGLLLGVVISYITHYHSNYFDRLLKYKILIYIGSFVIISAFALLPSLIKTYIAASVSSYLFTLCVLVALRDKTYFLSEKAITFKIAVSSYSTYLAHSLFLHIFMKGFAFLGIETSWIRVPIMFCLCFLLGYVIYIYLEKPIIKLRNKYVPAR